MAVRDLVVSISFVVDNKTLESLDRRVTQLAKELQSLKKIGTGSFEDTANAAGKSTKEVVKTSRAISRLSHGISRAAQGVKTFGTRARNAFRQTTAGIQTASKNLSNFQKSVSDVGGKFQANITNRVVGAATAAAGLMATLGFGRLIGMDEAQAKLKGLGYEGEAVNAILKDVENAVRGTAFTMAEGTNVAAGALAAGVKQGKELERYIKLVGSAAAGSNSTMGEMAMIFNRIQGTGRMMTGELNMIEDRLPGFTATFAKEMGVSIDRFREMVSDGEITSKQFLNVMEKFAGGMAEAMAESWTGLAKNVRSNIGIIGQNILEGLFEDSKKGLEDFLETLRSPELRQWAKQFGEDLRGAVHDAIDFLKQLKTQWDSLDPSVRENIKQISLYAGIALVTLGPALKIIAFLLSGFVGILKAVGFMFQTVGVILRVVGFTFTVLWKIMSLGGRVILLLIRGLNWLRVAFITRLIPVVFAGIKAFALFTKTLLLNPFTWIALAIIGVVMALVYLATNWDKISTWLKEQWERLKQWAGETFDTIKNWVKTKTDEAKQWIEDKWNDIVSFLQSIDLVQIGKDIIGGLIDGIRSMAGELWTSVTETAGIIKDRIKNFFGIASPSKLTMEFGTNIGEGLKIGLDKSVLRVAQTAQNLARAANPAPQHTPERAVRVQPTATSGTAVFNFAPSVTVYVDGNMPQERQREVETNLKRKMRQWWQEFRREEQAREV